MNKCPNCAAELESRPCKACGWPESTHPGEGALRKVAARRSRRERQDADPKPTGCCSTGCSWAAAFGGTAGLSWSWNVGATNHWSSDGAGILFIYLLVAFCGWLAVLYGFVRPHLPSFFREVLEEE